MNGMNNKEDVAKSVLLLGCLMAFLVACFIIWQEYDRQLLRREIELLENSLEEQRGKNLLQLDSLQKCVYMQQQVNRELQDSLGVLQQKRKALIEHTNEKKAAIIRIRDVDSLRDVVSGNYR